MDSLCLIPDAQFDGPPDVEETAAKRALNFAVSRAGTLSAFSKAQLSSATACALWQVAKVNAEILDQMPNCKVIARCGTGYDQIDLEETGRRGIPVCNVPDYGTGEVADHAIALALNLVRGITCYDRHVRANPISGWDHNLAPLVSRTRNRVFGIVGLGRIGTATAMRAKAFGYDVRFFDPYICDGQDIALGLTRERNLASLAAAADILSLHTPLSKETTELIGPALLSVMKSTAIIVNTSRGHVLDVEAVLAALAEQRLGGLGLDVLPEEPPSAGSAIARALAMRDRIFKDRLLVSPHSAFYSPDAFHEMRFRAIETIVEFLASGRARNCVNAKFLQ